MRFATPSLDRCARADRSATPAFAAPVWLWCDPDRPECGHVAVDDLAEAKAVLYWPALASHRHDADGRVRADWLAAFIAIDRARTSRAPERIEAARRLFRDFADASGTLVTAYAVASPGTPCCTAGENASIDFQDQKILANNRSLAKAGKKARPTQMTHGEAMTTSHKVRINGEEFWAASEEILLDAALRNGIDIPHDCRSGQCGKCHVRTVKGQVFAGELRGASEEVHACQSRVIADVTVAADTLPDRLSTSGHVADVRDVSPDVVEIVVVPSGPMTILPGQYLNVSFDGFPARAFCPTVCLEDPSRADAIHFHVQRIPEGRVSGALGHAIAAGHRVKLTGPFGSGHLQPGLASRLVLVAEETGFAPIWSIAAVALQEEPDRRIELIVGSAGDRFYMEPALRWLARYPNVRITRTGCAAGRLPELFSDDVIHVAGPPSTVHAVVAHASAAGAAFFAETFAASDHLIEQPSQSLFRSWGRRRARHAAKPHPDHRNGGREAGFWSRGIDFYLRAVAATGAAVACSGIFLGALLPLDGSTASGSSSAGSEQLAGQAAAHAALAGERIWQGDGDVPDLPIQVAVQIERDRHWALASALGDADSRLRPGTGDDGSPSDAKETAVAGVWAPDVSACSTRNKKRLIPAVITADGASAGDTLCTFKRQRPTETGMDVVASCANANRRWTAKVRLTVTGNRLVWSSERGTQAYFRCEPNLRMAEAG